MSNVPFEESVFLLEHWNMGLHCQHILEGDNMVADSLSCNNLPTFEAETPHLPSPTERVRLALVLDQPDLTVTS